MCTRIPTKKIWAMQMLNLIGISHLHTSKQLQLIIGSHLPGSLGGLNIRTVGIFTNI